MKNLFSVNKTHSPEASDFDEVPYLSARVSEEVKAKLTSAFSFAEEEPVHREPTEEEKAMGRQGRFYWILCVVCFLSAMILFFGGSRMNLYESMPALHILDLGLLVAAIVFNFKARRISRKQTSLHEGRVNLDFSEATKRLEEAAGEAARELGVPEGALSVDILPFHYKMKGDTPVPTGKKNRFDNLSVSMYVEDSHLCMATAQELYRIPLDELKGYRTYDEDFEIDMWLKPEEHNSEAYAEFGIRKSGFFSRKAHGFFGLDIDGRYEVLIPCYDFPVFQKLVEIKCLDESSQA